MSAKIEKIKEIANRLSDYKYVLKIADSPDNRQNMMGDFISVYGEPTLSHGLPAICMLYSELYYQNPDEGWDFKAHEYLKMLQKNMENGEVSDLSMFSGYAGIGLTVNCLSKNGERYSKLKQHINNMIRDNMDDYLKELYGSEYSFMRDYDVISGLSGILSYTILESDLADVNKSIGEYLVFRCKSIQYKNIKIHGLYIPKDNQFLEQDRENYPEGNYNLGLSHGIPGVLIALCMLKKHKYKIEFLDEAIESCATLLYKYISKEEKRWIGFLSMEDYLEGEVNDSRTRDAWCYGSPGVSYALCVAGKLLQNEEYCNLAIAVMKNMIGNIKGLFSPSFCHGYIGVAYIYWRLYEITGMSDFKEYAEILSDKVWEFYSEEHPFGFEDIEAESVTQQVGLLSGVSGIMLPLLAMEGYRNTNWSNAFMLGEL
ncbi:MAG: lanthionine synthetase C family protein [Lachnospiraceae bacterium]|nr:lanthionine synthetase C family protein [Lachnospiraceae bacterium]